MAGRAPTATPAARVDGVDAARGLALIGMFVAHVSPVVSSVEFTSLIALADERPRLLFALGPRRVRSIEVTWPSGRRQRFPPPSDRSVLAVEDETTLR